MDFDLAMFNSQRLKPISSPLDSHVKKIPVNFLKKKTWKSNEISLSPQFWYNFLPKVPPIFSVSCLREASVGFTASRCAIDVEWSHPIPRSEWGFSSDIYVYVYIYIYMYILYIYIYIILYIIYILYYTYILYRYVYIHRERERESDE